MKENLLTGMFTILLAITLAASSASAANGNANGQDDDFHVTICHNPPGNPDNPQTITVGQPSVLNAHLEHGDSLGACLEEDKDDAAGDGDGGSKDEDDGGSKDEDDGDSKDDDEGSLGGACACLPGAVCVCADGSAGDDSYKDAYPGISAPSAQRELRGQ